MKIKTWYGITKSKNGYKKIKEFITPRYYNLEYSIAICDATLALL
jgi:hypothetical protein